MSFGGFVEYGTIACRKGHTIVVPSQSPSRIFRDQPHQPTETPQATFLCIECGEQFPCTPEDFRLHQFDKQAPDRPHPVLWRIEGECVLGDSGKLKPIYFAFDASGSERAVRQCVLELVTDVECTAGHQQKTHYDMRQISVTPILHEDG